MALRSWLLSCPSVPLVFATVGAVSPMVSPLGPMEPGRMDSPLLVTPSLLWVNTPVLPNETALVQGAHFGRIPHVTISQLNANSPPVVVTPLQVTNNSIMVVIPASFMPGAFDIQVSSVDPVSLARSAPASIIANAPELWWVQGDPGGSKAVAGGLIRVFGRGLSIEADSMARHEGRSLGIEFAALAEQLQRAARQGNTVELARITEEQQRLLTQHEIISVGHVDAGTETTLLLEPHNVADSTVAAPLTLFANKANLSTVAATFKLPVDTTPGVYTVCISNGPAKRCLDSFYSATQPRQQTLEIVAASTVAWPDQRFEVDDLCKQSISNTSKQLNCTDAILATIAKAGAAGGGLVVFGLGRYYMTGPLLLPDNVRLQGAGMGMTALYFQFSSLLDVPQSFVSNTDDARRYGVSDLDIYILSFYVNVFNVGVNTDGVEIHRVRVRANSMFCQNMCENGRIPPWSDQACGQDMDYYGKRGFSDCPKCAWPWREQPVFALFGNNWQVTECDIFSTYNAFYSGVTAHVNASDMSTWQNYSNFQSAQFGLVRGNKVLHGGNCHWWDGNKQLIYEQNSCTGASPMAGGSNIATYEGGDAHHLYLGGNSWTHTYGNDREVMTYDDAGTVYTGPLLGVSADGRNLTLRGGNFSAPDGSHNMRTGAKKNAQLNHGKVVLITNGTGAGQYRRVVDWNWDVSEGGYSHWVLDRPFDLLSETENIQIEVSTFRGNNIFHNNHYEDCGVFQFYGVGINNLVVGMTTKRQDGIVANGQRADFFDWSIDKQYHSGTQPNLYNQFIGIEILEGLRADHREESLGDHAQNYTVHANFSGWEFGDPLQNLGYSFAATSAQPTEEISQYGQYLNRYLVYKRNRIHNNGGIFVNHGADILIECNEVSDSRAGMSIAAAGKVGPYGRTEPLSPAPFLVAGQTPGCGGCGTQGVLLRNNLDHGSGQASHL